MLIRRIIIAVVLGELLPILVLVAAVALFGPSDPAAATGFARGLGAWVGPVAGATTVLLLARWAGAGVARPVLQGSVIGVGVALLDGLILWGSGEAFAWLFVASNGGKVVAGFLGGWWAATSARSDGAG